MWKILLTLFFVPFVILGQVVQSFDTQLDTVYFEEFRSDNSTDSTSNIVQTLDTENQIDGPGCMRVEYIVDNSESWGGFVKIEHVMKEKGSMDWSAYDSISFWYNNVEKQDLPGRVHLRFNLYENSSDTSGMITDAQQLEFYYSFHYILDNDPGWHEIKIPLIDGRGNPNVDENNGEAFNRTGWSGITGNDQLDKAFIKGFCFEFSINGAGEGDMSSGAILIDNLRLKGSLNSLSVSGFEQGAQEDGTPVGWEGWQSSLDGWGSLSHIATPMSDDTVSAHDGSYYAELGVDAGNGYAVIWQGTDAQPGQEWQLSAFIRDVSPADPGGDFAALKIEAKQGETILKASEVIQVGVTSEWKQFTTSMIMPEGTELVNAVLVSSKWLDDGIAAVYGFDDVTLVNLGIADTTASAAPSGVIASADAYFNQVVWQDVAGETGETYSVYASTSPITDVKAAGVELLQSGIGEDVKTALHYLYYPLKEKEVTYYYAVTCTDAAANTSLPGLGSAVVNTAKAVPTISLNVPSNLVLDGDISEWEDAGIMPFEISPETHYTVNPSGGIDDFEDLSATVYMAVDDNYLYVAADVIDDAYYFGAGNWYDQDAFEFFIGLYDSRSGKHAGYARGNQPDYSLYIDEENIFRSQGSKVLALPEDTDNWYFEAFNPDYVFEARISLDSIMVDGDARFHPKNGMRIPFELYFHDNDGSGHEGNLAYSPLNTDNAWQFPQEWGYTWIGDTSQVTDVENQEVPVAQSYQLKQNYPNPFNPETTIEFNIAKTSNVKISIFNIVGQELEVLVNSKMQAGNYKTVFNGAKYASGIYFYRIEAGNFSDVRKMLIVK